MPRHFLRRHGRHRRLAAPAPHSSLQRDLAVRGVPRTRATHPHAQLVTLLLGVWLALIAATPALAQQSDDGEADAIATLLAVHAGATVADVGAGSGFWTVKIAALAGPGGRIYATEVKPDLAREIQSAVDRAGLDNVTVILARDDDPKLPEQCCEAVLLRFVYHALQDPTRTLQGLRRAVKPGGRVLIVDFRPTPQELTGQMRAYGFEPAKLTEPWLGNQQTYGALFLRSEP